ncbi:MAG: hypothetical protein EBS86_11425, partial [Crocinitomicaceae bacterium]|nr:hypothetical protein [Crocinitomicaceae bacterium]
MATMCFYKITSASQFQNAKQKIFCGLFSLAALILSNNYIAQNYSYKLISTKDGLPSSTITGITKDKNGIIWIGTEKGLCYISNGKIQQFKGLPDEGILSVFASSDGSLWIGYGEKSFLVRIKNGKIKSFAKQKKAAKNGSVLSFHEHNKHIYLAQNDGITVISPEGKFKPLTNKIVSDTMMSYWTVDFFTKDNKVYATSVIRGVNEVVIRDKDVVFKNVYTGEFLYGSTCLDNNLILTFDPDAKLFNADKFLRKQVQTPIKKVSSRLPSMFITDKNKNVFGACYNFNYGIHGLIKLDKNFTEELILPENIPGQELFYDKANNEIYFGTGFGVYIVNASLYSKSFAVKKELTERPIISSYPEKNGVIALTEGGLLYFDAMNTIQKQISVDELRKFANNLQVKQRNSLFNLKVNSWTEATFNGLHCDDLKFINNKWFVLSTIGFFIVNKKFEIEDFIPIPSSHLNYTKNDELLFDQYKLSLICLKNKPKRELLYDCFRQDKLVLKHVMGIEKFGQKNAIITESQGVYIYDRKALHPTKLKGLNSDVYRSTSFQNKYLVISTVNGEILFYDSEHNFKLVKTIKKSQFYNESIIDLKGNGNYLVFITSKRIFIWDGNIL